MFKRENLNDPALKKLIIEVQVGQVLFKQNDKGNSMYLIVEGSIKLTQKIGQSERMVGILGAGEVVGERAICVPTPYKRSCSAHAETDTTLLEFDAANVKSIQAKAPDFTLKLLAIVSSRIERMNRLIGILQLKSGVERIVHYLAYCLEYRGTKSAGGLELECSPAEVAEMTNVTADQVNEVITELVAEQLIAKEGSKLTVRDENALIHAAPSLKERIAA